MSIYHLIFSYWYYLMKLHFYSSCRIIITSGVPGMVYSIALDECVTGIFPVYFAIFLLRRFEFREVNSILCLRKTNYEF